MQRPFRQERPFGPFIGQSQKRRLIAELESVIGSEESAREEYETLIRLLEENDYIIEAEQVQGIMEDEIRHSEELTAILSSVRRDT